MVKEEKCSFVWERAEESAATLLSRLITPPNSAMKKPAISTAHDPTIPKVAVKYWNDERGISLSPREAASERSFPTEHTPCSVWPQQFAYWSCFSADRQQGHQKPWEKHFKNPCVTFPVVTFSSMLISYEISLLFRKTHQHRSINITAHHHGIQSTEAMMSNLLFEQPLYLSWYRIPHIHG